MGWSRKCTEICCQAENIKVQTGENRKTKDRRHDFPFLKRPESQRGYWHSDFRNARIANLRNLDSFGREEKVGLQNVKPVPDQHSEPSSAKKVVLAKFRNWILVIEENGKEQKS